MIIWLLLILRCPFVGSSRGRDSNLVVHLSCASSPSSQRSDAAMEMLAIAVEIIGPTQRVLADGLGWETGSITGHEAS